MTATSHTLTIGEFAKAAGTTPRTLRHFESLGLIRATRAANGRRHYTAEAVTTFLHIMTLKNAGFSLKDISGFTQQPIKIDMVLKTHIAFLEHKLRETEKALKTLKGLDAQPQTNEALSTINLKEFCQLLHKTTHNLDKEALRPLLEKHFTAPERALWEQTANRHFPPTDRALYSLKWDSLIKRIHNALQRHIQPASEEAAQLAAEWLELQKPLQDALGKELWSKTASLYEDMHSSPQSKNAPFSAEILQFIQSAAHHRKAAGHLAE
ncbi:MerR family transcriptional regulator [Neokomagataea thailandica NBRC 106555]|uniref:MerR family transcriptional regulator n=2 Tax=Neokomagataea TaxID=1223423 RepID=A0A4Y6V994_9PROT|nr:MULTISPECIES: MerR family transcriptional regulator [Neokomagataea]QDH24945.1 MerR family transcriptional regulator [Neokomagataea tanensis]GBR51668.1 MerR family transcriptional regulator [Neokomagataea thailandica NBRC 106555]